MTLANSRLHTSIGLSWTLASCWYRHVAGQTSINVSYADYFHADISKMQIFRKKNWFLKRWEHLWGCLKTPLRLDRNDKTQHNYKKNLKNHLEQNRRCIREAALTVWHVGLIMWSKQCLCPTSPLALLFSQHGEADSLAAATSAHSRINVEKWLASKKCSLLLQKVELLA